MTLSTTCKLYRVRVLLLPLPHTPLQSGPQNDRGVELSHPSLLQELGDDFARDFSETPEVTIAALGAALRLLAANDSCIGKITARIVDFPDTTLFKDLKACSIGRFVSVRGTVVRVGPVRPLTYQIAFLCLKCSQMTTVQLPDGIFRPPARCKTYNCPGKQFVPDRTSAETVCRNYQKIKYAQWASKRPFIPQESRSC